MISGEVVKVKYWQATNRALIAKVLSELHFEEKLHFSCSQQRHYSLQGNQHRWQFQAVETIWGMLVIDAQTISCETSALLVTELLLDIQAQLTISDINLAGLLEEIQQTLYSDQQCIELLADCSALELVQMDEVTRQRYLQAHPKAIANKGRLGWGSHELAQYTPESAQAIQLEYIAIDKTLCRAGYEEALTQHKLMQSILTEAELQQFEKALAPSSLDEYFIFAVHPWQLQRFIFIQYAQYFADGSAVHLGRSQQPWLAQQSIRTLSAGGSDIEFDVKTALTILNTSCYRGIPGEFIEQGPVLSAWLADITSQDNLLNRLGLRVQKEVAGVFCAHPQQSKIEGSYRYHEMLGCIWRESAQSVLDDKQRPLSMATLMQEDINGEAAIVALIKLSGLKPEQWIRKLFQHVVVPLYHLMCRYGVALVAHGQNITLVLQDDQPVGCLIKDFHGDLRLVDQDFPEFASLDKRVINNLTRLPPQYLIHDLVTGHFVTVLRFVSPKLASLQITETQFYAWLADEILTYQAEHLELVERFALFDILTPKIEKICVNRVRFKVGYGDSEERPIPELGTPIDNPLYQGMQSINKEQQIASEVV